MHGHHENPFQYFRAILTEMEQMTAVLAKRYGAEHLGGPQGCAILYLLEHEGEEISFKDMEQAMDLSKSVVSNLIKRMEKNGFLTIIPSEKDKRVKYLVLTEFGREKAYRFNEFLDYMHGVFLKDLSKEDFDHVHRVIKQVQENIRKEEKEKE